MAMRHPPIALKSLTSTKRWWRLLLFVGAVCLAVASLVSPVSASDLPLCRDVAYSVQDYASSISSSVDQYSRLTALFKEMNPQVSDVSTYFCAATAPEMLRCSCVVSSRCAHTLDSFGRNIGSCECCQWWVYLLVVLIAILLVCAILVIMYHCFLSGWQFFDGFPRPYFVLRPRRRPGVAVPASQPIPMGTFGRYNPAYFINDITEGGESAPASDSSPTAHNRSPSRRSRSRRKRSLARNAGTSAITSPLLPEEFSPPENVEPFPEREMGCFGPNERDKTATTNSPYAPQDTTTADRNSPIIQSNVQHQRQASVASNTSSTSPVASVRPVATTNSHMQPVTHSFPYGSGNSSVENTTAVASPSDVPDNAPNS